jgi:hypothetical protein
MATRLNIIQAIALRRQIEAQPCFPMVQLLSASKEVCLLFIKAELVNVVHFRFMGQVANENNLYLHFEQGYWVFMEI